MTHPSLTFSPDSLIHLQSSIPLSVSPPLSTPFKASISTPNSRQLLHWRGIFFTGTSSRHLLHWRDIFFTGTSSRQLFHRHDQALSSLSRRLLAVTGWLQIKWDLIGSGEISLDLARSLPIQWDLVRSSEILARFWLDLAVFCHGTTISSNHRKLNQLDRNRSTNPPDPTSLMDG